MSDTKPEDEKPKSTAEPDFTKYKVCMLAVYPSSMRLYGV